MLIIIILTIGTIVGIILYYIGYERWCKFKGDNLMSCGITIAVIFGFIWFVCVATIIANQAFSKMAYRKLVVEKEMLEYRLKNENLSGNELLYRDITEFNLKIEDEIYVVNNPWISWFGRKKIANIGKIEVD